MEHRGRGRKRKERRGREGKREKKKYEEEERGREKKRADKRGRFLSPCSHLISRKGNTDKKKLQNKREWY